MEKATSTLRRSGAFFLSYGTNYHELNYIISDLTSLKSQVKAMRDTQQSVLQEVLRWTTANDNRALKEVFTHLIDLNTLWTETQTAFAEQIAEFRKQFEMILEGEKNLDAARHELSNCEAAEEKAQKKLKKAEKKNSSKDLQEAQAKLEECKNKKELMQNEVSEKVMEHEAVKLMRLKSGLLKLSQAYLTLSHKCIYIFEAKRDIIKALPDVEDKDIHEMRYEGLPNAEEILQRARALTRDYQVPQQSQQTMDPPPPYTFESNLPFNPYYVEMNNSPDVSTHLRTDGPGPVYPSLRIEEELAQSVNAAKI